MAMIDKRGKLWRARVRLQGFDPKSRSFDTQREACEWPACAEQQLLAGVDTNADMADGPTLAEPSKGMRRCVSGDSDCLSR